jgi:streptogramin lyase
VVTFQDGREVWSAALEGDVLPVAPVGADARDGTLWVVDKAPPRLLLFAFDGASLGWVDLSKWARSPFSIALGPSGEAFVSDPLGPAVLAFSPSASFVGTLDLTGTGVTRPTGLAVGPEGRLWVSDGVTGRVACIDTSAQEPGQRCVGHPARFHDPLRLSWWDGALWILEGLPGRVQRLEGW